MASENRNFYSSIALAFIMTSSSLVGLDIILPAMLHSNSVLAQAKKQDNTKILVGNSYQISYPFEWKIVGQSENGFRLVRETRRLAESMCLGPRDPYVSLNMEVIDLPVIDITKGTIDTRNLPLISNFDGVVKMYARYYGGRGDVSVDKLNPINGKRAVSVIGEDRLVIGKGNVINTLVDYGNKKVVRLYADIDTELAGTCVLPAGSFQRVINEINFMRQSFKVK